jgi:hypothetical protein
MYTLSEDGDGTDVVLSGGDSYLHQGPNTMRVPILSHA